MNKTLEKKEGKKPIEAIIDANVHCNKCGTRGFMKCDCYHYCYNEDCGWIVETGKRCGNPNCNL